jgi:hypothetical protein
MRSTHAPLPTASLPTAPAAVPTPAADFTPAALFALRRRSGASVASPSLPSFTPAPTAGANPWSPVLFPACVGPVLLMDRRRPRRRFRASLRGRRRSFVFARG